MSSDNPIIVNCGATHVSLSVFSAKAGRLKLEKFFVQSLSYDYANEDAWLPTLAQTLRRIVSATGLSGPARVIVPGYRLLTKNIKVPQVERSRQKQMIGLEAQNQLPDAHELVWDSQVVASDGIESEVILFAHKTAEATLFTEAVCSTGLKPIVVEAATLLDYQAYRLANERSGGDAGDVLLVNIGARSTNLTFVSGSGFSIQNISLGGNWFTQTLADGLGERFPVAEELKTKYFLNRSEVNSTDPLAHTLDSQAQNFAKRLAQDISRRIINYKRSNQNRAPGRILLTGRGSLLPGLRESLAESLRIPTDFFEPTSVLDIAPSVPQGLLESANRFQMSEAVGEAAALVLKDPVGVNLIPGEISERMEFSKRKPYLVLAAALLAIAPLPVGYHFWTQNKTLRKEEQKLKAEYSNYENILNGANGIKEFEGKTQKLAKRVEDMSVVAHLKTSWFDVLRKLQVALIQNAGHAWIESLTLVRPEPPPPPPVSAGRAGTKAPPPKPAPLKLIVKVRVLLENVSPTATYDPAKENAKFSEILERLKECDFAQGVEASNPEQSPNMPARTFIITLNSEANL